MTPLYVIDNSNFIYRFKSVHKYAQLEVNGVKVNIAPLVGYIRSLKSTPFTDICIVLDGDPVNSKSILSSYKGLRSHELEDTNIGIPRIELVKFLTKLGERLNKNIKVVCAPNQEADQVISSIAHIVARNLPVRWSVLDKLNTKSCDQDKYLKTYMSDDFGVSKLDLSSYDSVIIGTTDADMAQLQVMNNIFVDTSTSGKNVSGERTADAVAYVNPAAIPVYKAIYGDTSDNVPSLKISLKKQDVIDFLNSNIKSETDVLVFKWSINGDWAFSDSAIVKEIIRTNQVKDFKRNWDITKLEFYSIPYEIEYKDYDIQSTIDKYKLRV